MRLVSLWILYAIHLNDNSLFCVFTSLDAELESIKISYGNGLQNNSVCLAVRAAACLPLSF